MSDALAAALMASQRRQFDPAENSRRHGQRLLAQGSSTAPVSSPMEGVARALQGALGGYFEGEAERKVETRNRDTMEGLASLLSAKTPEERAAATERLKQGDPSIVAPFMAQQIAQRDSDERKMRLGQRAYEAAGGAPSAGAPASPAVIGQAPPLPAGTPNASGFNNNLGNIRATNINWEGKGAPHNGFETFGTPQQGANAMAQNFDAYAKQNPNITVAQAIAKWAPPNENDTNLYIRQVAEGTGINPATPLAQLRQDPAAFAQLLDAVTRKEKGGLPAGVTADTFTNAAGGGPGLTINIPQGSADASGNPLPPQQQQPAFDAGAEYEALGKRAAAAGDFETATKYQAQANTERAKHRAETDKRQYDATEYDRRKAAEAQEHDRRELNKPPGDTQALSAGFADRMTNSNAIIGQFASEGTSKMARMLDSKVFGVGVPFGNSMQTEGYQRYRQARDDFINSQLRRESGAVISPEEYDAADRQYFPQPGDAASVIAQKERNRQIAVEGMVRNAGVSYRPSPSIGAPAAPQGGGAPQVGVVMDGYRFKGGNPADQNSWEPVR